MIPQTASRRPAIRLEKVSKRYALYDHAVQEMRGYLGSRPKDVREMLALDDVTLTIHHGERVGIIGHNGSGKTTLLRVVCGFTQASSGGVDIDGTVQALMQTGYGFSDELSGLVNIRNALVYNGLPGNELAAAEAEIVDFVELAEFLHYPLKTYSLGMRARLEFATATAIRPSVLVIDEVLGAGDGYFVHKCAERMRKLVSGTTLLLVSHALDQIKEYCERAVWIDAGHVREDGPVDDVLEHYRSEMMALAARLDTPAADAGGSAREAAPQAAEGIVVRVSALLGVTETIPAERLRLAYADQPSRLRVMETGDPFALTLSVFLDRPLQPVILGLSAEGLMLLFELDCGPILPAGRHQMRLEMPHLGVGVGRYFLLAALREADHPQAAVCALAGEVLELRMAQTNWSEPPLVHMDGQWTAGVARTPLRSKLTAWV